MQDQNYTTITRNIIVIFISTLLFSLLGCKEKTLVCREVIHSIKPPSFTMEQKLIIGKYHNILYSKLNNPESYYIGSVEELSEERFLFVFFPLSLLQSYILRCSTDVMEEHCGGIIGLDGDISIVINKDGEIIESNEKDHSEPIFR